MARNCTRSHNALLYTQAMYRHPVRTRLRLTAAALSFLVDHGHNNVCRHLDSNQEHTSRYIRGSRLAALSTLAYDGRDTDPVPSNSALMVSISPDTSAFWAPLTVTFQAGGTDTYGLGLVSTKSAAAL